MSAELNSNDRKPSTYHMFCEAFKQMDNNSNLNEHNMSIIHNCTKSLKVQSNDLIMLSLALCTPIAQFFVDIYFQYVLKYNSTINEFMKKSKFLSMLSHDGKPFKSIRKHLSEYLKCCYLPITTYAADTDDEEDDERSNVHISRKHNMASILYYTSVIHENIYILKNKVCQIDVIFIPQLLNWIDDKYFMTLGIKYEKFDFKHGMKQMMRYFNDKLKNVYKKFKRCVILIMANKEVCKDTVYLFEPLENNSLFPEIYNHTEIEWICNTKANILPDFSSNDYNALCLSFHRHVYHNNSVVERVYLSHGIYGCRVFKYNFVDIVEVFCVNKDEHPMIDWGNEIKNREFKDHEYDLFLNAYFVDLKSKQTGIDIYLNEELYDYNIWIRSLCKCVDNDKRCMHHLQQYMYAPSATIYYQYMNIKIGEYYKLKNKTYNNQFINFIYNNELENCELADNLGVSVDINDCVLLDFDSHFPVPDQISMGKEEFLFIFLKKLLL